MKFSKRAIRTFKPDHSKLPPLLDKESEVKRLDSIREETLREIDENKRIDRVKIKDKEMIHK